MDESYLIEEKSGQMASAQMPAAPQIVDQPAGGIIQPHTIPDTDNAHVQQPSGQTIIVIPSQPIAYRNNIIDYIIMCLSIFSCLFCFWPIGMIAIAMSSMACSRRGAGDLEQAENYSKWALGLSIGAIICGVIMIVLVIIFYGTWDSSELKNESNEKN